MKSLKNFLIFFWNICGFVLDSVDLLYFKFDGISLDRDGLYIDTAKWLKNKKVTKNPKINDDKCLQYAVTLALNYRIIEKDLQGISKINPFIDQYDWKEIDFLSNKDDWKEFKSNNESITLNILHVLLQYRRNKTCI